MIYVCIDTNVYINLLTEVMDTDDTGQNDAPTQLDDLNLLCKEGVVTVLIPEVVKLELQRANNKFEVDCKREYSKLIDYIDKYSTNLWSEIRGVGKKIITLIEDEQDKKIHYWINEYSKLMTFFAKDYIQHIELNPDIICESYKKKVAGLITDSQINDAIIIESIHYYFRQQIWNDDLLFFITGDKKDFFAMGEVAGFNILKSKFKIPNSKLYGLYNLKQLYKYINANFDVGLPKEEIETKWSEFEKRYPEWDFEDDEVREEYCNIEKDINLMINKLFESKLQDLPKDIIDIRKRVLNEIETILLKCRNMVSWDNRSELKLYQWLNSRSEINLYSSKLSDLFLIRDNLQEYLKVHEKMDEEILEGHDWKKCCKCNKTFVYQVNDMNVQGGKDSEGIICPYCNATNGSIITDGFINTYKAEEILQI